MRAPDSVAKFLTDDASIRVSAVIATNLVNEMKSLLDTSALATVALGRSMVGCVLMVNHLKEGHRVGLYFRGTGPLGTLFSEADHSGAVRGYVSNSKVSLPLTKEGRLDVAGGIGHGILEVVRGHSMSSVGQDHTGTVHIKTGEIGDDIAFYLQQSQQIPSVIALGVHLDKYGNAEAAGGVLVELMPGTPDEAISLLEKRAQSVTSVSRLIMDGAGCEDLVTAFMADFKLIRLDTDVKLRYECRCSLERVERSFVLLGTDELDEMIQEANPVEVTCEFCGRRYTLSMDDLNRLRQECHRISLH